MVKLALRHVTARLLRKLQPSRAQAAQAPFHCRRPTAFLHFQETESWRPVRTIPLAISWLYQTERTMKFGKRLQRLLQDSLPEWRDKFISYKLLKQHVKLILSDHEANPLCVSFEESTRREGQPEAFANNSEADFIALLYSELDKINSFFLDKEEEFVIRFQRTKRKFEKLQETHGGILDLSQEMVDIRKAIVNIHGEMVLLENYSALNYTGLVKIIKKHDKRTGRMLRILFIQIVLQQPFFATDIISQLVQQCEETLQALFPHSNFNGCRSINSNQSSSGKLRCYDQSDLFPAYMEISGAFVGDENVERICRNTMAAWWILREFRKGSSTYNFFSVPPFGWPDFDELGCKPAMTKPLVWHPEVPVGPKL